MRSGNNMPDPHDPPSYDDRYGFPDGAQNDLFPGHDESAVEPSGLTTTELAPGSTDTPQNHRMGTSGRKKVCKRKKSGSRRSR